MEELFKFLFIAAVIAVGIVKQAKKENNRQADEEPDMPMPDIDNPLPEPWKGDPCGDFIPERPRPKKTPKPKKTRKPSAPTPHASAKPTPPIPEPFPQESEAETSAYGIHSAEEARKAIIWSEILGGAKWKAES